MDTGADGGLSFDGVNGEETDNVVTYSIHQLDADSGPRTSVLYSSRRYICCVLQVRPSEEL
jgi:hypothetical protein